MGNKLITLPLAFGVLLSIFTLLFDPNENLLADYEGLGLNDSREGVYLNETTIGRVEVPDPQLDDDFINVWTVIGAIVMLAIGVIIVTVIGFRVWNTGLSETSINVIFVCTMYASLWGAMTLWSFDFLTFHWLALFSWVGMTIMFVVGILKETQGTN